MKKLSFLFACASLALVGVVGCSEDAPPSGNTNINPVLQFKVGDKFTYEVYDRDTNNVRVDTSKMIRTWEVIGIEATFDIKTNVAKVLETNFKADGATLVSRDTIYIKAAEDGEVSMYDVLGKMVKRVQIPDVQQYADSIPKVWVRISDTKRASAGTYHSLAENPSGVSMNITDPISGKLKMDVNANHKGRQTNFVVRDSVYKSTFSTDHNVSLNVTDQTGALVIVNDSVTAHYDVDLSGGLVKQTLNSDKVAVTIPIVGTTVYPVNGFEMVLMSYTRVK